MAKAKGKGKGDDPHAPFDKVTLTGTDGKEHDVTDVFNREGDHSAFDLAGEGDAIALFPESQEEKDLRSRFYDTKPARSDEHVDAYAHAISVSGSLKLQDKLDNCETVSVSIADADGQVIASGMAEISVGFSKQVSKEAVIMVRGHKAKLR
jgi:hypothetical protein